MRCSMSWRSSATCGSPMTLGSAHAQQVDDEGEGLAGQAVTAASGTIGQFRWAHQLAPSADLHAGDALLPGADQLRKRKLRGLPAVPRRVELLTGVELDAHVVHVDDAAGDCFRTGSLDEVGDLEFGGRRAGDEVDFRLFHPQTLLQLAGAQAKESTGDDELLDLLGALEDVENLGVA